MYLVKFVRNARDSFRSRNRICRPVSPDTYPLERDEPLNSCMCLGRRGRTTRPDLSESLCHLLIPVHNLSLLPGLPRPAHQCSDDPTIELGHHDAQHRPRDQEESM